MSFNGVSIILLITPHIQMNFTVGYGMTLVQWVQLFFVCEVGQKVEVSIPNLNLVRKILLVENMKRKTYTRYFCH